jgi:hypothetical protein
MKKFEYKVFDIDELEQPEEEFLNKMGLEGWELVQIHNVDRGVIKKMITNKFIKINCKAYVGSGITNLYKKISKKKFSEFYKIYTLKMVNKN